MTALLIANRGEIAIRIARAAAELGMTTVGVFSGDDAAGLHTRMVDRAVRLSGVGARAYLDPERIVATAVEQGCQAVHPGYGFLSENADLARRCAEAGITFVGPDPATLDTFGNKVAARELAATVDVPVLAGTPGAATLEEAQALLASLGQGGSVMVKAVAGGGGRGMRPATSAEALEEAYTRCASEAGAAFGDSRVYVEAFLPLARHVEVQMIGDGDTVRHLWDRECSLQRRRQKVVEVAPALAVDPETRAALLEAATRLAGAVGLRSLCTMEFLVPYADDGTRLGGWAFIEANPRLQVEHTVTEEVTGLDLVRLQLRLADGATLGELGLGDPVPAPRGIAVQVRVNAEVMAEDGSALPAGGTITSYQPPSGPGVRVDGCGFSGYQPPPAFDPLLAKVVTHVQDSSLETAMAKAARAVNEFVLQGTPSNLPFLSALLADPAVVSGQVDTRFIERHLGELLANLPRPEQVHEGRSQSSKDRDDPLAIFSLRGNQDVPSEKPGSDQFDLPDPGGVAVVRSPLQGTVVSVEAAPGEVLSGAGTVVVLEAMKMEHPIPAGTAGVVVRVAVSPGDTVYEGDVLAHLQPTEDADADDSDLQEMDLELIRPDLAEVLDRHSRVLDGARPDSVAGRRRHGKRTARENIDDLCDEGSFTEYGPLVVAGRFARNSLEELIEQTPADGLVMGLAHINRDLFGAEATRAAVLSYDYSVLAGTQGARNHFKLDRMAELALRWRLPTVFFTEGGGGRPGDTDRGSGFIRGFEFWGQLSGKVPLVGITSGRCFAGNAVILGCCDVIIATRDSALGMGGPAMVEGGGLGLYRPEEIGPLSVMQENGVIDILVDDEPAAVATARQYLGYFQGRLDSWACADQRILRHLIPESRLRAYDVRTVIETLADSGSVLELRPRFGRAMITALIRVEGHPVGLIANNPSWLGGAVDADASDKAARLLQLCEAYGLPVLSLSDTPGNMVGPEAEKTGLIRHCSRLFVIGANLSVPLFAVVLRKSYGLGAIAMTGGSYQKAAFSVSWPTGEFGGMGLEGQVKLGQRKELAAIEDPLLRKETFDRLVDEAYAQGKAMARATHPGLDDVIDPADTRRWIVAGLEAVPARPPAATGSLPPRVPWIDAW